MKQAVEIFEVGPRDGLQNEPAFISSEDKIALTEALAGAGLLRVECASFVSPRWVPQMADATEVLSAIERRVGVVYAALTPNARGFANAVAANADEVAIFGAASEGFSQANINCSIAESLARFVPIIEAAKAANIPVRGYVSCITECPYDGPVDPSEVARLAELLHGAGCDEISLGDTIGTAYPEQVARMLEAVVQRVPAGLLAGHFHDTAGRALANIDASLDYGLRIFDASIAGLGGCPYAPGAKGNVDTQLVYDHLVARGYEIAGSPDRAGLERASRLARKILGRIEGAEDAI